MTIDELITQLQEIKQVEQLPDDAPVQIDAFGLGYLTDIEEVGIDASDEGAVIIWARDMVP